MLLWASFFYVMVLFELNKENNYQIEFSSCNHFVLSQTNESEKQSTYEESQKRIVESQTRLKEEIAKVKAAGELQEQNKREGSPSFAKQQLELLQTN